MRRRSDTRARWGAVVILLGTPALASAHGPVRDSAVSQLSWLSGDWVAEVNDRWTEEQWSEPRGGMLLGLSRTGKADRALGFEFMRITDDGSGKIVFWGSPGGRNPVPFRLVELGPRDATFANPSHDFPKRISYRRDGDRLVAAVSGDEPSKTQSWTYRLRISAGRVTAPVAQTTK